jgi:hypothetical protein
VKRLWPFDGEAPVTRARRMVLAYQQIAREQRAAALALAQALRQADTRLLAYDSPATLQAIKTALKALDDGDPVTDLDKRFCDWGETFHVEQVQHYEMDDYVKATEAAKLIHVTGKTLNDLRIKGRIKGQWSKDVGNAGGYLYKVEDVYKLSTQMRGRGWRKKGSLDTLSDSGRGDTE